MSKVLIIEDESLMRETVRRALELSGYEVLVAANGDEGLAVARSVCPDLIISDINMEKTDGYAILESLREDPATATIPFILMTGYANQAGMRLGMEKGADDYLAKPFTVEALLAAVEARLKKQHIVQQQAETTRSRLVAILEASPDLVAITDSAMRQIHYLNAAGRQLLGVGADADASLLRFSEFQPQWALDLIYGEAIPAAVHTGVWTGEAAFLGRGGETVSVQQLVQAHQDSSGRVEFLSIIARDITGRKQAEEQLRQSREQMRALAGRLQAVREEERAGIAREVHDELGQALTGLKIDLAWLARRLGEPLEEPKRQALLEKIATMSSYIDQTINTVRKISSDLRPGVLDDLGLAAAIEWQAGEYHKRTGIKCALDVHGPDLATLQPQCATALFRIFQEILTNIARHARATGVRITLAGDSDGLTMEVADNGRGISAAELAATRSLGILGMRERAQMIGGEIRWQGEAGVGTTVTVRMPLEKATA